MERPGWLAAVVVLVVALAAGAWYGSRRPEPPPLVVSGPGAAVDEGITAHVAGAVVDPGLVSLPAEARVADAVAAAGGVTSAADLSGLNLAAPVHDGAQIVVPVGAFGDDAPGGGVPTEPGRIRINTATAGELEALPGVGPVLAARILAHREEQGPFRAVEDLLDVPGIGEAKLETMRDAVALP